MAEFISRTPDRKSTFGVRKRHGVLHLCVFFLPPCRLRW